MGEARRRQRAIAQIQQQSKLAPRKQAQRFSLVHHKRLEEIAEDGVVYARHIFRVIGEDGLTMAEETPDGPRPVLFSSVPQPIRRTVLSVSGLVTG